MLTKDDLEQLRVVIREEVKKEVDPLHERFDAQNQRIGAIERKMDKLDAKIDKVQESVEIVQEVMVKHFGNLDERVTKIEEHMPHSKQ